MRSFADHCAFLQCPLKNTRWSWSALSADKRRALFTIWADEVKGRRFILYPITTRRPGPVGEAAELKTGARELREVAEFVVDHPSVLALGVLCTAEDPQASPRVRKHFDERTVFKLDVYREGGSIVAEFAERVPVERVT